MSDVSKVSEKRIWGRNCFLTCLVTLGFTAYCFFFMERRIFDIVFESTPIICVMCIFAFLVWRGKL